jgi:hypothetical protein
MARGFYRGDLKLPLGSHDDQVDALSQALNYVRDDGSYSALIGYDRAEKARQIYQATGNFRAAAVHLGVDVSEVEEMIKDACGGDLIDEYERAYAEAEAMFEGGGGASRQYGGETFEGQIGRLLAEVKSGR